MSEPEPSRSLMTSVLPTSELTPSQLRMRLDESERRLRETVDELDAMTSLMNHDFRSPLVSIVGFAAELEMLTDELHADGTPRDGATLSSLKKDITEAARYLRSGAQRMATLLDQIAALGMQRRRLLEPALVDLNELLQRLAMPLHDDAHIEIAPLPSLHTDRPALTELLAAVLDNAVRFPREHVPMHVRVSADEYETHVELTIEDNGRGIADEDLKRVFRPFVRLVPHTSPGHGLGLAHARVLARRLGGDLTAHSRIDHGSSFTLRLPRHAPSEHPSFSR